MNRLQTFKRKVTKQCNPIFKKQYMQYVYIFTVEWKKQYRHSHNKTYNKPTNTFLTTLLTLSPKGNPFSTNSFGTYFVHTVFFYYYHIYFVCMHT